MVDTTALALCAAAHQCLIYFDGSVAISDGVDNSGMKIDLRQPMSEALRAVFKRLHYPIEIMLTCVRWYVAYRSACGTSRK